MSKKFKNGKAAGIDDMAGETLKDVCGLLREWQCNLSTQLKTTCVPNDWKNDTFAFQYRGK